MMNSDLLMSVLGDINTDTPTPKEKEEEKKKKSPFGISDSLFFPQTHTSSCSGS